MSRLSVLFVHSPLVGPSSLQRLADSAASAGHQVALPDLTSIARAELPHEQYTRCAAEAARSLTPPVIIVGHSGAGAFLPAIGRAVATLGALVFVDAVVPPRVDPHRTPDSMKAMLDEHTEEGLLRPWLDWWPVEVVAQLLPDPGDRTELARDMPQLTRSFYDVAVEVPAGWADGACGYLRLSKAYEAETEEAISRGWPTAVLDSTHLGTHTEPDQVLVAIMHLADQLA